MNIFKKILLGTIGSLTVFSCNYLDVDPLDTFDGKTVFSSFPMINAYISARYNEIWTPQSRSALRHASDEAAESFNWGGINGLQQGYMSPDYWTELQNIWKSYYTSIQACNVLLEQEETLRAELAINPDEEKKLNRYLGEMKFVRAFLYSELMARYGDIIISDKAFTLDMGYDEMYLPRTSYDKCVEFVVDELTQAADWLPVAHADAELGHATKGAALALKAACFSTPPALCTTRQTTLPNGMMRKRLLKTSSSSIRTAHPTRIPA